MIKALKNNNSVLAYKVNKDFKDYKCPCCGELVILKKGMIKTHHFAHKVTADCINASGEGEIHLSAKLAILNNLLDKGFILDEDVFIECMLPNKKRIADQQS